MKKSLILIAILFMAISFSYSQIALRNNTVNQIANSDTLQFRITPSTTYINSTNPVSLNTDTLKIFSTNLTAVSDISNTTFNALKSDTVKVNKRIGVNTSGYFSLLEAVGGGTLPHNLLNLSHVTNKNRSIFSQFNDSSCFYLGFSPTGSTESWIKNKTGSYEYYKDSSAFYWSSNNGGLFARAYSNTQYHFFTNTAFKGMTIMNLVTNGAGGGGTLTLCQHSGAITANAIPTGTINFGGAWGTAGTNIATPVIIRSFIEGTPSSATDIGGNLQFSTTPDGAGPAYERIRIVGGKKLSDNTITNIFTVAPLGATINSSKVDTTINIQIQFGYTTSDGTDSHIENGVVSITGVVKNGTTTNNIIVSYSGQAVSTGTLAILTPTCTWNNSTKVYSINMGWDSSLNQTGMINYNIFNFGYGTVTIIP